MSPSLLRKTLAVSLLSAAALAVGARAWAEDPAANEAALARKPIEAYLQGHATGDPAYMRAAFLPTAHIEGMREGKFVSWTADEYISRFSGKPAADEAQRTRRIDSVEVSGSAGTARATLTFPNAVITDFFVLLKVDGEWKIANKVYSSQKR